MRLSEIGRLWRTARHLEPIQIVGRVHFRLARPRPDLSPPPPRRAATGPWTPPAVHEPSMVGPLRFRFLAVERALDECGWDRAGIDRLWRYNLHYFDDLNAQRAAQRETWHRELLSRWLAENPPPQGTAWEPYPVSLRIVNWVKWFLAGHEPEAAWLHSLAVQARWLRRRLEWHLLGNHLFVNAKALVYAGLYFDGAEADGWLRTGLRILERELPRQVLGDGGHFERSTMYHALALEDLLDLVNLAAARAGPDSSTRLRAPAWRRTAQAMLYWLRCMSHPDGGIALFNDAADGIAPSNAELEDYARRLELAAPAPPAEGVVDLMPSGYVRAARGPAVALLDLAPLGPDCLPGHAHADTLAFELSLHGRRVVVNGGTSCYGSSAQRLAERGTAWHSTVQLDGGDSSEVWSGFRVGRRARVVERGVDGWTISGCHDGWGALPGSPRHRRRWTLEPAALVVDDEITPAVPSGINAVARYHLAPGLVLVAGPAGRWQVLAGGDPIASVEVEVGDGAIGSSLHAPRFGVLRPAQALVITLRGDRARTRWLWNPDAHPVPD